MAQSLSNFNKEMDYAYDIKKLKQTSPYNFRWQDKASEDIKKFKLY